jgi:hypothetical protein
MKRYISVICSILLVLSLLVGCSTDASTEGNTSTNTSETRATNSAALDPTAVELLEKAIDELDTLNGVSFKHNSKVSTKVDDMESTMKAKLKGDVNFSPYKAKVRGKVSVDGFELPYKIYEDEKYQYVYDDESKKWEKFELFEKTYDFKKDLEDFLDFLNMENSKEWITFTQNGDTSTYLFQLDKVKDEKMKKELLMKLEEQIFGSFEEGIVTEDLEGLAEAEDLDLSEFEDVNLPELDELDDELLPEIDFELPDINIEKLNIKLTLKNNKPMLHKRGLEFTLSAGEFGSLDIEDEITITDLFKGKIKLPKAKERKDKK